MPRATCLGLLLLGGLLDDVVDKPIEGFIFDRWTAGDSVEDLAKDFARPSLEVEEAIRCEQQKVA